MAEQNSKKIVIIGSGYTGIWAYRFLMRRIGKQVKNGAVKVTVISPKNYHSFHGWTAESLCNIISIPNRQSPLRYVMRHAELLRAHAYDFDLAAQQVKIRYVIDEREESIPYDHLLLANGAYDALEAVQGLRIHGWSLKEPGGVLSTRNHLIKILDQAQNMNDPAKIEQLLTVVVAGGGFAGVEIASNVAELFHVWRKHYPILETHKPRVVLVHSGDALLPQLRPQYSRLADYATRELEKYGVEIHFKTRLTEVKADRAVLSDGGFIPSVTVISTIGQRSTVFPGTEALPRSANGLIMTDEFLHVQGYENVWTGGDTAQVPHIKGGYCQANALWAIMHGVWAGKNIALSVQGKSKLKKFNYRGLGQAASLGVGKGATELYGMQFTGWIGWILRFGFFTYFMPSRGQAVRMMLDWFSLPFVGRYITPLESVERHILADKRAKESTATMELPAIVIDTQV